MKIKFKKVSENAVPPRRGTEGSAGWDLAAISCRWNEEFSCWEYGTGIAVEIPRGYVGLCGSRSSIFRTGLFLSNGTGWIDSDYRGEIKAKFYTLYPYADQPYKLGEYIVQLTIVPILTVEFEEAEELSKTARGEGGYGSPGK